MTRRDDLTLFLAGLLVLLAVAFFQHAPGYMDADYYLLTGQQLAAGRGLSEPVLWNYLDEPSELPHPSHAYWMPLPSFVAAAGMLLFGGSFAGGRVIFILLAALAPPVTARLAMQLSGSRGQARLAGWLAVFSGFYLPYLPTTDSFGLSMLLGCGLCWLVMGERLNRRAALGLGALAGLLHLARAEGLLWLALALAASWRLGGWRRAATALGGYALVMGPWLLRNWLAFGSALEPGAGRTLWLTSYDELFSFPADQLNAAHWLASGWGAILQSRLSALGQNLASALVVEGLVFLAPLVMWGAWAWRDKSALRFVAAAWAALLIVMSFVFPFSGARGGFFHAAAALQPMLWALAAAGLGRLLAWGERARGWKATQAGHVFSASALLLALALSVYAVQARVIGSDFRTPSWNASAAHYAGLAGRLQALGAGDAIVMVNNPPGFALASGGQAIVVPDGGVSETNRAAQAFGAQVLLLEANHPAGWDEIYAQPQLTSSLRYVETVQGTHIFYVLP